LTPLYNSRTLHQPGKLFPRELLEHGSSVFPIRSSEIMRLRKQACGCKLLDITGRVTLEFGLSLPFSVVIMPYRYPSNHTWVG